MCGIAGVYNSALTRNGAADFGRTAVGLLSHRGPDDHGVFVENMPEQKLTVLVHTRLSIQDVSQLGHQPMCSDDGRFVLVFNGEVYNFHYLRDLLNDKGYRFASHCDTEVVLKAYHCWGRRCFEKFNGMWSLAIYDRKNSQLLLSRDRFGIKPLYYTWRGDSLVFASEIKALLSYPGVEAVINPAAISDYLSYRMVLGNKTFYKGIHEIPPGCHYIAGNYMRKTVRYWDLSVIADKQDPGEEEALSRIEQLLEQSVRFRMISDVPFGAYLSGGLDSSAIVASMVQVSNKPVKTFTVGFPEKGYNEFEYARCVAEQLQTEHHEITLDCEDYFDLLPKAIGIKDQPLSVPNEIPLYLLSEELKKHISVVLSGEGADELFGGYGRIFRSAYDALPGKGVRGRNVNICRREHFVHQYSYIEYAQKQELLSQPLKDAVSFDLFNQSFYKTCFSRLSRLAPPEQYMWIFQKHHLQGLLRRLDAMTMSSAVEARVPFVDHELVEYVNSLPVHYKLRWISFPHKIAASVLTARQISEVYDITKYALRRIYNNTLPQSILQRKKVGFPVPLHEWMGSGLSKRASDILLSSRALSRPLFERKTIENWIKEDCSPTRSQRSMPIWMLLNIELWMQQYRVTA